MVVVFDFGQKWPLVPYLIPLLVLGLGLMIFLFPKHMKQRGGQSLKPFWTRLLALFFIGIGILLYQGMLGDYRAIMHQYHQQSYQVVEGPIENYQEKTTPDVTRVLFQVSGVHFSYLSSTLLFGISPAPIMQAAKAGGNVRIAYIRYQDANLILKLERKR